MRSIKNAFYWLQETFARLAGDIVSAEYYAAKREENS